MENERLRTYNGVTYNVRDVPTIVLVRIDFFESSWDNAFRMFNMGLVSQEDWRRFCFFWKWDSTKCEVEGRDRALKKLGEEGVYRRFAKVWSWRTTFLRSLILPYAVGEQQPYDYRGWTISYDLTRPVSGRWRAERRGVGMNYFSEDGIKLLVDISIFERKHGKMGKKEHKSAISEEFLRKTEEKVLANIAHRILGRCTIGVPSMSSLLNQLLWVDEELRRVKR